jgi:cytochrome c553
MRGIAASLSEQDMADLGAFYASHASKTATETPKAANEVTLALIEKGACASCHGANFSKPIDPSYPKIGGQHADYLYVALRSYKINDKPMIGRSHPVMAGIATQFSDKEMKVLADYVASLPSEIQTVQRSRVK